MSEWLKALWLGIIEGITEYLPISSTGHLIVAADVLQLQDSLDGTFEIFIQIGGVAAVLFYYRRELWQQVRSVRHNTTTRYLWRDILIAFIPAAGLGLLLGDWIDGLLFNPVVVALALIAGGLMFLFVERRLDDPQDEEIAVDDAPLTWQQALVVGLWQVLALIPGMSRSGMSIIGGMVAGVERQRATQFSFYLAIPTLGGATVYTLLKDFDTLNSEDLLLLSFGALVSAIVAWLSIRWLLNFIAHHTFVPFGYYRIFVGVLILLLTALSTA